MGIGGPLMIFGSCRAGGLLAAVMPRLIQAPILWADKGSFWPTLFFLWGAHALCDYALQGQFMSDAKNHHKPIPGVPWFHPLLAHALIHGCAVAMITNRPLLGLCESILHLSCDYLKCSGKLTFNQDQLFHYGCKVIWAIFTVNMAVQS